MRKGDSHCECNGPTPRVDRLQDYWGISVEEIQDVESDLRALKSFRFDKSHVTIIALLYSNAAHDKIIVRTTLKNNISVERSLNIGKFSILYRQIKKAHRRNPPKGKRDQAFHGIPNPPSVV